MLTEVLSTASLSLKIWQILKEFPASACTWDFVNPQWELKNVEEMGLLLCRKKSKELIQL